MSAIHFSQFEAQQLQAVIQISLGAEISDISWNEEAMEELEADLNLLQSIEMLTKVDLEIAQQLSKADTGIARGELGMSVSL